MGRETRIEFYGAIYHIIQRGNNKAFIFENNSDKMKLLSIIGDVKDLFDFYLISYCIMDNHYHFVIKTHNIPISTIMHRINTRYAKYYNYKYKRTGSPFEGRYRSIIVHNDYNLFNLINYVHNNPVYGMMVENMTEYKWSSDVFYRMNLGSLVDIDFTLDILSLDRAKAVSTYENLMGVFNQDYENLKKEFEYMNIIGGEDESIQLKERFRALDEILKSVCPRLSDYNMIKSGSKKIYLLKYKYEYTDKAKKQGFTNKEISENINISERSIRNFLNRCQ